MRAPTLGNGEQTFNQPWSVELQELPDNWDSYGAPPISYRALVTVGRFAVVPCSSGGVQLEIHQDGYDIEIEIEPTGKISSVLVCHQEAK